jgi:hypothetical protein
LECAPTENGSTGDDSGKIGRDSDTGFADATEGGQIAPGVSLSLSFAASVFHIAPVAERFLRQNTCKPDSVLAAIGGFRPATQKNYNFAWGVWGRFLDETDKDIADLTTLEAVTENYYDFLTWMQDRAELSTGSFMLFRSALSSLFRIVFDSAEFGKLYRAQLLSRRKRIEQPRQSKRTDVFSLQLLLSFYRTMEDNAQLSDCDLRAKVATMLILYIMLRPEDMVRINISKMYPIAGGLQFSAVLKNRQEYTECVLSQVDEQRLCPVAALQELWHRVKMHIPEAKCLFFDNNYLAPLTKYHLQLEMKGLMQRAGIPSSYTPYSIKHASITYLLSVGVDEMIINKNARLSRHSGTAVRHYFVGQAGKICAHAIADRSHILPIVPQPLDLQDTQFFSKEEGSRRDEYVETKKQDAKEEEEKESEEEVVMEDFQEAESSEYDTKSKPAPEGGPVMFDFPVDIDWSVLTENFDLSPDLGEQIQLLPPQKIVFESTHLPTFMSVCDALCASGTQRRKRKLIPCGSEGV